MSTDPAKKNPGGRPRVSDKKIMIASLRGRMDFAKWLGGLQGRSGVRSTSSLIELALIEYARNIGFEQAPPRR